MDIEKVRVRFRYYREEIARLVEELDTQGYYHNEAISRAEKSSQAYRNETAERERQAESDRWYREDQIKSATKELERARSYDDKWGEERALKKLKSIY